MRKNKKGYTLVEVILAVFIFSIVALPLLGIYLQSVKTDVAARNVLNANYIAQNYIEQLYHSDYKGALNDLPSYDNVDDFYLSAAIRPYGSASDLFSSPCIYAHLLLQPDGKMLAVMPDGKWQLYSSIPSQISMSVSGGGYTLSCDSITLSGTASRGSCVLIVNAMKKPSSGTNPTITLGQGCKTVIYCTKTNASSVQVIGDETHFRKHIDVITGNESLIHVSAFVYESASSSEPITQTEAYIAINNWVS